MLKQRAAFRLRPAASWFVCTRVVVSLPSSRTNSHAANISIGLTTGLAPPPTISSSILQGETSEFSNGTADATALREPRLEIQFQPDAEAINPRDLYQTFAYGMDLAFFRTRARYRQMTFSPQNLYGVRLKYTHTFEEPPPRENKLSSYEIAWVINDAALQMIERNWYRDVYAELYNDDVLYGTLTIIGKNAAPLLSQPLAASTNTGMDTESKMQTTHHGRARATDSSGSDPDITTNIRDLSSAAVDATEVQTMALIISIMRKARNNRRTLGEIFHGYSLNRRVKISFYVTHGVRLQGDFMTETLLDMMAHECLKPPGQFVAMHVDTYATVSDSSGRRERGLVASGDLTTNLEVTPDEMGSAGVSSVAMMP